LDPWVAAAVAANEEPELVGRLKALFEFGVATGDIAAQTGLDAIAVNVWKLLFFDIVRPVPLADRLVPPATDGRWQGGGALSR
jgi:hypothetical protein